MDLKKTHNKCKEVFALMFPSMSGHFIGLTRLNSLHTFIIKRLYSLCMEWECYISLQTGAE